MIKHWHSLPREVSLLGDIQNLTEHMALSKLHEFTLLLTGKVVPADLQSPFQPQLFHRSVRISSSSLSLHSEKLLVKITCGYMSSKRIGVLGGRGCVSTTAIPHAVLLVRCSSGVDLTFSFGECWRKCFSSV